jgi:hypothetical protein
MKPKPIIVCSFILALATSAYAGPFTNPDLDAAYDGLSAAAANLALAQSQAQQNGDYANAASMAPILAMANYTLGQLTLDVDVLNASTDLASLIEDINEQAGLATYYATNDTAGQFQTQPAPDPTAEAASHEASTESELDQLDDDDGDGSTGNNPGGNDGGAGDGGGGGGGYDPGDGDGDEEEE